LIFGTISQPKKITVGYIRKKFCPQFCYFCARNHRLLIKGLQMDSSLQEQLTVRFLKEISVPKALGMIILISTLAFLFLIWLIYFRETSEQTAAWVTNLPALNALLNSASTVLILFGLYAIKKREFLKHMKFMLTAFITSSLFLISYLVYHNFVGHTPFPGEGFIRPVYFFILISHIILSAFVVPLVLTSYYFAFSGKFSTHKKVSKWTLPIWLYVSVTGVVIFFILNAYV
jgi:putative membrane protein